MAVMAVMAAMVVMVVIGNRIVVSSRLEQQLHIRTNGRFLFFASGK